MAVIPVPSNRSSDLLLRSRLLTQLQQHQLDILRVQDRLATGLRLAQPSDDSPAATRAIRLQMLLEQKQQSSANLQATASYLAAAEGSLTTVSSTLIDIRGLAISVNNTTTADVERDAAVQHIRLAVDQLMRIGNRDFRERYLFSGSRAATAPFETASGYVAYRGNEKTLGSFVDLGLLQDANLAADELFGVYSRGVSGSADLTPVLTEQTRLADLNSGRGIAAGSFVVSDGTSSSTVDIASAVTLGDVVRLIEDNPPGDRRVVARITSSGLWVDLDDNELGGNLTIRDVSGSTSASELGIDDESGTGVEPIEGRDIDPRLRLTTRLENVLGSRATGVLRSSGANNDVVLEATQRGAEYNGFRLNLVDDSLLQAGSPVVAGSEFATFSASAVAARGALEFTGPNNNLVLTAKTAGAAHNQTSFRIVDGGVIGNSATVSYDSGTKTLTIGVDSLGQTQVQTLIQEIDLNSPFSASYDDSLASDGGFVPTATIWATDINTVTGGTGNSGGDANTIFVHVTPGSSTANHVVAAIEASSEVAALVTARIDEKDTTVANLEGEGIVDPLMSVSLAGGSGVEFDQSSGLRIVNGGDTFTIDLSEAETIEDLLNAINGSEANVVARINDGATGIDVRSVLSGTDFSIGENGGQTATQLGLRSLTESTILADLNHGLGVHRDSGVDFTIIRNDGNSFDVDLTSALTIGDVIDTINDHPANQDASRVEARLALYGNGIELIDESNEGANELTVVKGRSNAAWDLGFIPRNSNQATAGTAAESAGASLSFPAPNQVNTALAVTVLPAGSAGNDITIQFANTGAVVGDQAAFTYDAINKVLTIDIDPLATTANSVVAAFAASTGFSVALDNSDDLTNDGTGVLGGTSATATTSGGVAESLQASDVNPLEVKGVFSTLLKLADAIEAFDSVEIERTVALLLDDLDRLSYGRAEMGSRGQFLDTVKTRVEDESIQLRETLSLEIDADTVETFSDLTRKQAALQAALQLIGRTFQLTLLDFL